MSLKKLIVLLVLFLSLLFFFDRLSSFFCKYLLKKSEFRFSRAFFSNDKNPKPNVLILGNSRGVNGIYAPDLNEYGYEAFNLSYNGMNLELAKIVLESYLINNPKPDKLILEISNIYGDSSLSNSLKMYSGES